jgi:hypothetical protein
MGSDIKRKLASIQRVAEIRPIEGADAIQAYRVLGTDWKAPASVEEGLALAEGPSINHKIREGLVWKCNEDPNFSFKAINNTFPLKGGY